MMEYTKYKLFGILLTMLLIGSISNIGIVWAKAPKDGIAHRVNNNKNCTNSQEHKYNHSHNYINSRNNSNCLNCTNTSHKHFKKRIHFRYIKFREKFKEFKKRYYGLLHGAEKIKGNALQLKKRIQKECKGNFSACDPELINHYINLTKKYLITRLEIMKMKLTFINHLVNDSNLTLTIENITELQLKIENVTTIDDIRALKPELISVYKEVKVKLARYGLLLVLNVQNKLIDRTITLVEKIKLKVNNTEVEKQLQEIENQLYNLKQEVENTINEFYNLSTLELAHKIKEIRQEYGSILKELREIVIALRR